MSIYLNGQYIQQPSQLQETPIPIQTDTTAMDGSMQRNYRGMKYNVQMQFKDISVSGYQQIMGIINTGNYISYNNTLSAQTGGSLTFSGLPSFKTAPYESGASLYQQLDVSVRQI